MSKPILSQKVERFTESVIREMTRLAQIHDAVNLAQGMPDFPAPGAIKESAYQGRRDLLLGALRGAGFSCSPPQGAYYIMADFSALSSLSDSDFTRYLVKDIGIAVVPGSSFFHEPERGSRYVRFCFCKKESTLQFAKERLQRIPRKT